MRHYKHERYLQLQVCSSPVMKNWDGEPDESYSAKFSNEFVYALFKLYIYCVQKVAHGLDCISYKNSDEIITRHI